MIAGNATIEYFVDGGPSIMSSSRFLWILKEIYLYVTPIITVFEKLKTTIGKTKAI